MLYLLIINPTMISAVAGVAKLRFQNTCAETSSFFESMRLKKIKEKEVCNKIRDAVKNVMPTTVKGDRRNKSVLVDAILLAKELDDVVETMEEDKWELISIVWAEMLSYAACYSTSRTHAKHVSKGGELLTFVWFLMAHFGLREQFHTIMKQQTARLIVG
ncbi:hypothetical protein Dsin_021259 [Dipteronia sinensis]|uniref:DUF4220 domain-containing protein n=1 Tax=Dipteronia sinensis TaxID=43782 RepID=A0AAE0DYW9_9ROSI|nr:hypothetical protein Dsin_021259 [Dipteronia sinensis]